MENRYYKNNKIKKELKRSNNEILDMLDEYIKTLEKAENSRTRKEKRIENESERIANFIFDFKGILDKNGIVLVNNNLVFKSDGKKIFLTNF